MLPQGGGRQSTCTFEQARRNVQLPTRTSRRSTVFERDGDRLVRTFGTQREVLGAFFGALNRAGQPSVHPFPCSLRRARHHRGRMQGMGEGDDFTVEHRDLRLLGGLETGKRRMSEGTRERIRVRVSEKCGGKEHVPRRRRERLNAHADECTDIVRNRKLARDDVHVLREQMPHLEGEERVSPRRPMESDERRAR
jgi:hypothetical protein